MLSPAELTRYNRHLILKDFGIAAQEKIKHTRVLVVGAGGLGAPLLSYLAAAGIGTIGIADFDVVEESNLQRQVLFTTEDIGKPKAAAAKERLQKLNPFISVQAHPLKLNATNALSIIREYDIIADGSDNFAARYLVNDCCVLAGKPLVYASIFHYEGQVAVFNCPSVHGFTPNYRDLYPEPPAPGAVPGCSEAGVLGVLPGIIGSIQANEVIKLAAGIGKPLTGKLLLLDALTCMQQILDIQADPANPLNNPGFELIDYEEFCNFEKEKTKQMKEISVSELKQKLDSKEDFQLIDVREPHEYEAANLGGELIPLGTILDAAERIAKDKTVVIHCRSGARSGTAVTELEKRFGFTNLYNLKGGILAYTSEIGIS